MKQWENRIRGAKWRSRIARWQIKLTVYCFPLWLLITAIEAFKGEADSENIVFVPLTAVVLILYRKWTRKFTRFLELPFLKEPSPKTKEQLSSLISPLLKDMGLDSMKLEIRIDLENPGRGASILEIPGKTAKYLIVPLGLISLIRSEPVVVRAIIAHELAHIRQDDWNLWFEVTGFARANAFVFIPFMAIKLVYGIFLWITDASSGISDALGAPLVYPGQEVAVHTFAKLCVLLAAYLRVIRFRQRSEFMADLGAAVHVGIDGVKCALAPFVNNRRDSPFDIHPSARRRVQALEELSAEVGCA